MSRKPEIRTNKDIFKLPLDPRKKCDTAGIRNVEAFYTYLDNITNIAINRYEYDGLPDTVDPRYMELMLLYHGFIVYAQDEVIGDVALPASLTGRLSIYREPSIRYLYADNGYHLKRTAKNSVIMYDNYLHMIPFNNVILYARKLAEVERTIEVNIAAQKTPYIMTCDETQQYSMEKAMEKVMNNEQYIIGTRNFDINKLLITPSVAPFVADKLTAQKRAIWNEIFTWLGIETTLDKKERLLQDEINTSLGVVEANRYVGLSSRQQAVDKINKMFGTNISVNFQMEYLGSAVRGTESDKEGDDGEIHDDDQ